MNTNQELANYLNKNNNITKYSNEIPKMHKLFLGNIFLITKKNSTISLEDAIKEAYMWTYSSPGNKPTIETAEHTGSLIYQKYVNEPIFREIQNNIDKQEYLTNHYNEMLNPMDITDICLDNLIESVKLKIEQSFIYDEIESNKRIGTKLSGKDMKFMYDIIKTQKGQATSFVKQEIEQNSNINSSHNDALLKATQSVAKAIESRNILQQKMVERKEEELIIMNITNKPEGENTIN